MLQENVRRWREQNALVAEEEVAEDEEEEEEGSRFLPHFRPRRWCWCVHAGSICPRGWQCTFATMSLNFIRTHGGAGGVLRVRFLDEGVDMPVIVHVVFFELSTVEVPQLPFLDKVVDVFFVQLIDGCGRPCAHAETFFCAVHGQGR